MTTSDRVTMLKITTLVLHYLVRVQTWKTKLLKLLIKIKCGYGNPCDCYTPINIILIIISSLILTLAHIIWLPTLTVYFHYIPAQTSPHFQINLAFTEIEMINQANYFHHSQDFALKNYPTITLGCKPMGRVLSYHRYFSVQENLHGFGRECSDVCSDFKNGYPSKISRHIFTQTLLCIFSESHIQHHHPTTTQKWIRREIE